MLRIEVLWAQQERNPKEKSVSIRVVIRVAKLRGPFALISMNCDVEADIERARRMSERADRD